MTPDPEQFEALLSRRSDGDLTAEESAALRRAVTEDPKAAAMARQYDRLRRLLAGWRRLPSGVDWQAFSGAVAERIGEDTERRASAQLDRTIDPDAVPHDPATSAPGPRLNPAAQGYQATEELIQDWARPLPDVDWDAFSSRVSAAVRREAAKSERAGVGARRWQRAGRWLVPLAAAACITLVVWGNRATIPDGNQSRAPAGPRVFVALASPQSAGRVSIAFDESPAGTTIETTAEDADPRGGVAIAIGPPHVAGSEVYDEAYFY